MNTYVAISPLETEIPACQQGMIIKGTGVPAARHQVTRGFAATMIFDLRERGSRALLIPPRQKVVPPVKLKNCV